MRKWMCSLPIMIFTSAYGKREPRMTWMGGWNSDEAEYGFEKYHDAS